MKAAKATRIPGRRVSLLSISRVASPWFAAVIFGLLIVSAGAVHAADREIHLTVRVIDDQGKAVPGAKVNVHQTNLLRFRLGIVVPPTDSDNTNAQGLARLTIKAKEGEEVDLGLEVAREDMETVKRDLLLAANSPARPPPVEFTLKKKSEAGSGPIIKVIIEVKSDEGPVEGANVMIRDTSLGAATGKFPGATGADGRATINVMYGSASPEETLPVEASKGGYKNGKIFINLKWKQVGQTVVGGTVKLEKVSKDAAKVTVTVLDETNGQKVVVGATVILDGPKYYKEPTNSNGEASFLVEEGGGYQVRITQDTYRDFTDSFWLAKTDKDKPLTFKLTPKANKDEGHDKIEVIVLKKDSTDEKSKPSPLPGASVRAGTVSTITDENGNATLEGAFAEKQEVTVQATGYKSKSQSVDLGKSYSFRRGKGRETFTLDPDLSENSPIRLIVEVLGPRREAEKIEKADVDFYLPNGTLIGGNSTKADGTVDFRSSDTPNIPIAELRKGLMVNVKKKGSEYKEVINRSVPADLLSPRLEASKFSVELERDWTEVEKALTAFEAKVAAWNADRNAAPSKEAESAFIEKALSARKRAEELYNEIDAAKTAFHIVIAPGVAAEWCQTAKKLQEEIRKCDADAKQKTTEQKRLIDDAGKIAATCSTTAEVEQIRSSYRSAIKLLGEIGSINKKAVAHRDALMQHAKESQAMKTQLADLQSKTGAIAEQAKIAEEAAKNASEQYGRFANLRKTFATRQVALKAEFAVLTVKYEKDREQMPAPLRSRFDKIESSIDTNNVVDPYGEPQKIPESVTSAPAAIETFQTKAERALARYRTATCDIDDMHEMVNGLNETLTNASFEIGLAADLPGQADTCAAKVAATPTPSPSPTPVSDEITVPDVSGFADPAAMKAGAGPDMVGGIMATKATPPPGTTKLFASQDPPANSKAKRGSTLKIFIYQSLAAPSSPTPTPTPSPSQSDEITVPDVSGFNDPKAMKAAAGPDLVGVIMATKATPPPGTTTLFASQDPPANTKAKRGSTLKIYIYQSLAAATATPAASGNMPSLIGLTLDQAVTRLTPNMTISSDEIGDKPPTPEQALTIFHQNPAAGNNIDATKPLVVIVKRYGSAKAIATGKERFDGTYRGSYRGADKGAVRFTVSGGSIVITSPGSGSGHVSASGAASISGSGADGNSTYSFSGTFSVDADGNASASGRWSGQQQGFKGSGTWSAAR